MATERHDPEYGNRTWGRVVLLIVALMGIGALLIPNVSYGPKVTSFGWVLLMVWLVVLVVGTV